MVGLFYDNDEASLAWGKTMEQISKYYIDAKEYKEKYEELLKENEELKEKYDNLWEEYKDRWENTEEEQPYPTIDFPYIPYIPSVDPGFWQPKISYTNKTE